MTHPIEFIINEEDEQRIITITPVNVTPATGLTFATGTFDLHEGIVGIGTITFDADAVWEYDGTTDITEEDIDDIANLILEHEHFKPSGVVDTAPEAPVATAERQKSTLSMVVDDDGKPVDVWVQVNYPFYDVLVGGRTSVQMEQDHHSNWFLTRGYIKDNLVQQIGRRIDLQSRAA